MKVVLAPFGTRGDVQPMVALGKGLRVRGHEVLLAGPENFQSWVESEGLRFAPAGPDIERLMQALGNAAGRLAAQTRYLVRDLIPEQFELLPSACEEADVIVGAGLQFVARSIADRARIPYAYVAYAPVALQSAYHPPPFVRSQRLPKWVNRMLWRTFGVMSSGVLGKAIARGRRRLGLPPVGDLMEHLSQVPLILAVEPALATPPPDFGPGTQVTGTLRLATQQTLHPSLERFLGAGPPPVSVGFGSMVTDHARALMQLFADAASELGIRLLIQAGWTTVDERDVDASDGCLLIDAAPHDVLFPRVRAAVHHGGAGTTTAVARAGIPQVILPHLLDQFYWSHRVQVLGLGPPAPAVHRVRRVQQVKALLRQVAETTGYAANAQKLANRLGRLDGVAETVRVIEELTG